MCRCLRVCDSRPVRFQGHLPRIILGTHGKLNDIVGRKTEREKIGRHVAARIVEDFAGAAVMRMPVACHDDGSPIAERSRGACRKNEEERGECDS